MKSLKSIFSHLLLFIPLLLAGCGDNDGFPTGGCGGEGDPCPAYAVELTVTPQLSTLAVATDEQYLARATYSDGTQREVTAEVIWSSSIPEIASIVSGGIASAETAGTTNIIATLAASQAGPEVSDSAILNVTDAAITSLTIEPGQAETLVGLTQGFKAVALFADSHKQDVTRYTDWSISESIIAEISNEESSKGIATGLTPGTTLVLGSYASMNAQAQLVVLDSAVEKLVISPVDVSFPVGTGQQYRADLIFENGLSLDVTAQSSWQSSVTAVASMNSEARLLGLEVGVTQVSASLMFADVNVSDSTSATVTQSVMTQLVVSPDNLVKPVGTQGDYSATAYYSDGSTVDVTHDAIWSVDDRAVAVIVESGEMAGHATAISPGLLTVTAAFEGLNGVVNAEVTDAIIESIELTPLDYITPAGTQVKYTARARFSDASVHDITLLGYWQSSEKLVANIGVSGAKAGVAHAKSAGVTEISINYMGLEQATTLTVTDAAVSGLQVTPKNLHKPQGTRGQYSAIANYTDGHTQDVTSIATWNSVNPSIVSVVTSGTNGGYATANDVGTTVIQATYAGFKASSAELAPLNSSAQSTASSISDSTSATVTNAVLEKLIISPLTASISAGNTQQYNLTGVFSDGSSKEVTEFADWQIESSNIAVIDGKGNALGLASGSTAVLASYLGSQAKAELIVTDAVIESLQVTPVQNQLPVGEKQQLIATAFYSDGHSSDVTQVSTWSSVDSNIVEVVSLGIDAGLAHALSAGDTSITAHFDGLQASAVFVVTDAILESVSLSPIRSSVAAGNSQQYQFTGIFSDGSNRDLTKVSNWQSSEGSVASVNRFGLAQTYIDGTTQVKASYLGFSATATLDVTDASLTGLQVTPANESVPLGTSGQYIAMAFYSDGHSSDVTQLASWSAVDGSIVSITATGSTGGFAEAIGIGDTQVQASFETLADSVEVSVTDVVLESYVVSPVSATVAAGLTQTYQATGIFSDGSNKDLTHLSNWQSSEPSIATLGRKGLATSYTAGEVTVTARYIGFTATAKLTVIDAELSFIQVTPANVKVPVATEGQFEAWAFYSDSHSEEITQVASWTSLNEDIVHIGTGSLAGGFASALTAGNTQIKAQFNGMSSTAKVEVTAAEVLELTISPENKTVASGLSQAYQAFARFSDGTSKEVTLESSWQSSNLNAATIDMDGLAQTTIGGEYKTVIKATYKGLTAETNLYVGESVLVEIQVTPVTSKVNINEIQQYIAMAYYSDGFSMDLTTSSTWTIGDDSIAHVVPSGPAAGQVTGDTHGITSVTAVLQGKTDSAEVVVTDLEYLGVDVEPADSYVIVGKTSQLQAFAVYQDSTGLITKKEVTEQSNWRPGNRNKISIDPTGLAHGLEAGSSDTFAIFQGIEGQGRMSVYDSEVRSLAVTPDNLEVPIGTKGRYKAVATMFNLKQIDVTDIATWSSSNTDVIHMVTTGYNGGMGTANSVGSSQITAEFDKSSSTVSTTVTPAVFEWIEITPKIDVIYAQVPVQFTATAYFSDDTSVDVTLDASWKSDSPQNAEMFHSIPGEAVGLTIGTSATISATYQGQSDSRLLSVEENYAVSVEVKPTDISLAVGGYQSVEVWVTFADGTSLNYADYVEWSSTDSNVATGRKDIISGHKAGSAVVTATFDGESGSANVTVN